MKNVFFLTICFLLFLQIACGQAAPKADKSATQNKVDELRKDYPNLKIKTDEINGATVKEDFNKVIDLTYPKYVEKLGGREKSLSIIGKGIKEIKNEGFEFFSIFSKDPRQIEKIDNEIFALVPIVATFKRSDGEKFAGDDFLIGVSNDGGHDWKFISGLDQRQLKILFPNIAEKIQIPETGELRPIENE